MCACVCAHSCVCVCQLRGGGEEEASAGYKYKTRGRKEIRRVGLVGGGRCLPVAPTTLDTPDTPMIPNQLTNAAAMLTSQYDFSASLKSSAGCMWRASWSTTEAGSNMMASESANADDC